MIQGAFLTQPVHPLLGEWAVQARSLNLRVNCCFSPTSWVALGSLLSLPEPQFPDLHSGAGKPSMLQGFRTVCPQQSAWPIRRPPLVGGKSPRGLSFYLTSQS